MVLARASSSARGLDRPARTAELQGITARARRGSGDPAEVLPQGAAFQLRHEHALPAKSVAAKLCSIDDLPPSGLSCESDRDGGPYVAACADFHDSAV